MYEHLSKENISLVNHQKLTFKYNLITASSQFHSHHNNIQLQQE